MPISDRFIFVHGIRPRSGTNFLARLISMHPRTTRSPKRWFEFPWLQRGLPAMQELFEEIPSRVVIKDDITLEQFLPLLSDGLLRYLATDAPDDHKLILKQPSCINLDRFHTTFPGARLIVIQRDGRDIVSSAGRTWPEGQTFEDRCRGYAQAIDQWMRIRADWNEQQFLELRYEDLHEEPAEQMKRVLDHVGLDPGAYPFGEIEEVPVIGSSSLFEPGQVNWHDVPKPKAFNPIGRWRTWSDQDLETFERVAGDALRASGYG